MTAATTERSMAKNAFSLGIAVYALAWAGVLVFLHRVFGMDVAAIILSLVLIVPLVVAVRMRCRWPEVRKHEFVFLLLLLVIVGVGSCGAIWRLYADGMHHRHITDIRFDELTHIAHSDTAFRHVEFVTTIYKQRYQLRGTVASQADLEHLQSLCEQYGFHPGVKEIAVADVAKRASE